MSENANTGCGDCLVGKKLVITKVPNLTSAKEVQLGKRPCDGKKPFNVQWCRRVQGWPAGSMVFTKCGYFFNVVRAFGNPDDVGSEWVKFDFEFLFTKLLEEMACDACPKIDGGVKPWSLDPDHVNLAKVGETWCFVLVDETTGVESHVYACAKNETYKDIIANPADWTNALTPDMMMCKLLSIEKYTNLDGKDHEWGACLLGCNDVKAEGPLSITDTLVDGKLVKLWKLLYGKGLRVVNNILQVSADEDTINFDATGRLHLEKACCPTVHALLPKPKRYAPLIVGKIEIKIGPGGDFTGSKALEEAWDCLRQHRMCPDAYVRLVIQEGWTGGTQALQAYAFSRQTYITGVNGANTVWNIGADDYIGYGIIFMAGSATIQISDLAMDNTGNGGGGTAIQTASQLRTRGLNDDTWAALKLNNWNKGLLAFGNGGGFNIRNVGAEITNVNIGLEVYNNAVGEATGPNIITAKPGQTVANMVAGYAGVVASNGGIIVDVNGTIDGFQAGTFTRAAGQISAGSGLTINAQKYANRVTDNGYMIISGQNSGSSPSVSNIPLNQVRTGSQPDAEGAVTLGGAIRSN